MAKKRGRGFKKTQIPGDRGYVRDRKDGGRDHKYSKSGRYHVDKADPSRDPIGHVAQDVLRRKKKRR